MSKIIPPFKKCFLKAVLALVFHSCLFYIRSRSSSNFFLLQETFQVFVKPCWKFTNKLPGLGLAACIGFVKHTGSHVTRGGAKILKVKHREWEHLYLA